LKRFGEALQINEQLGNLNEKAIYLNYIARLHYEQRHYQKAINHLEEALKIYVELGLEDSPYAQNIKGGLKVMKSKLS